MKNVKPFMTAQRQEMIDLYRMMEHYKYYAVVEEYSVVNRRVFIRIYDNEGSELHKGGISFGYPISDERVYEDLSEMLVAVAIGEQADKILATTLAFVPTHAASLLEYIRHQEWGLANAIPYFYKKDWDSFMKNRFSYLSSEF